MNVDLVAYTPKPQEVIAESARVCYLSEARDPDANKGLIRRLRKMGHMSVFEHASATFEVSGISRACSHQLVRHRIASYSQQSQRYVNEGNFSYVTPDTIDGEALEIYEEFMEKARETYGCLREKGVPKEDARFVLPNACETKIRVTMNFREYRHFIKLRTAEGAQWEIKKLAEKILKQLRDVAPVVFEDL